MAGTLRRTLPATPHLRCRPGAVKGEPPRYHAQGDLLAARKPVLSHRDGQLRPGAALGSTGAQEAVCLDQPKT